MKINTLKSDLRDNLVKLLNIIYIFISCDVGILGMNKLINILQFQYDMDVHNFHKKSLYTVLTQVNDEEKKIYLQY